MGIYHFLLQLNLRENFIRYGIIAFSGIIFGIIYAILRLNGIENLYLLIFLTCFASTTGHYSYRAIRKRLRHKDLSYQRVDISNLISTPSMEFFVDAQGILSHPFPPSGSIISYTKLQKNYTVATDVLDREIYWSSGGSPKILLIVNG
jgi:hypothetical protein